MASNAVTLNPERAQALAAQGGGRFVTQIEEVVAVSDRPVTADSRFIDADGVFRLPKKTKMQIARAVRRERRLRRKKGLGFLGIDLESLLGNTVTQTLTSGIETLSSSALDDLLQELGVTPEELGLPSGTTTVGTSAPTVIIQEPAPQPASDGFETFKKIAPWVAAGGAGLILTFALFRR